MKKDLEIIEYETKVTKAGKPYSRFKTNDGWMSCFDEKVAALIMRYKGKTVTLDIMESGEFKNIKNCFGSVNVEGTPTVSFESPQETKVSKGGFPTSMKVSYAKDLVIAGKKPEEAIAMIHLFEKAFS